jgi:hypothetical protein
MSPSHIKAKAKKYRKLFGPIVINSQLNGNNGAHIHIKHSTLRDLLALFDAIAEPPKED